MARDKSVILDDDDPLPPRRLREAREEPSRDGFEWGMASTIIGAAFLILGPLFLLLLANLPRSSYDGYSYSRSESSRFEVVSIVAIVGAKVLCIAGFFFGLRGLSRARSDRSPPALPLTGILLCIAAIVLWLMIAVLALGRDSI
jgi:hypothetical protein